MHHINELLPQPTLMQTVLFALFCAETVLPAGAMDEAIEATRREDYDAAVRYTRRIAAYAYAYPAYAACTAARTIAARTAAARAADAAADAAKYAAIYAAKYAANAIDLHAIAVRALAE